MKICRQACSTRISMRFSQGSISESLVKKESKLSKLFNVCWNHVLFILYRSSHFQQTLNNFVNFNFFFTKLSEIDPCEKCIDMLGGHAWRHIFMACSKLEAMAIYVVKQACGNEIMPSVCNALVTNNYTMYIYICNIVTWEQEIWLLQMLVYNIIIHNSFLWEFPKAKLNLQLNQISYIRVVSTQKGTWILIYYM